MILGDEFDGSKEIQNSIISAGASEDQLLVSSSNLLDNLVSNFLISFENFEYEIRIDFQNESFIKLN